MSETHTRPSSEEDVEKKFNATESADQQANPPLNDDPAPDGGFQAWLVALGASCILFCSLGFSNSFGVFLEYLLTHQLRDRTSDDVAWIGSLSSFLMFMGGLFGGPAFDRYGAWLIRPAAVIYIFSVMMVSLCKEYWQFMLAQGVLMGFCQGFLQFPSMAAVSQYFDKKRATAMGIVISGSSIGGVVMPIALSKMLNSTSLGFGWSVRIVGFIMVPLLIFSCISVKARLSSRQSAFFKPEAFRDKRFGLLIAALFFGLMGMFTPLFYYPSYAVSRGMDPTLASYMVAILNAASTFGRIIPGILADKLGRLNILVLGTFSAGIILACMNQVKTNAALIVYAGFSGFWSGTILSSATSALSICCKDMRDMGTYMGMSMSIASVAVLIGPPINGALINHYHNYSALSIFSGVMCITGGVFALVTKVFDKEGIFGRI